MEPVKKFLEVYQDQTDIYRACSALTACDMYSAQAMGYSSCNYQSPCSQDAIEYLVSHQFKDLSLSKLLENVQAAGVNVLSSGWVDFDFDGTYELWFTVVPPDKSEIYPINQLWIASGYPNEIKLFSAGAGIKGEIPDFQIELTSNGEVFVKYSEVGRFLWSRDEITKEPRFHGTVMPEPGFYSEELDMTLVVELRHQVQSGVDSYELYVEYMKLKKHFDTNLSLDCVTCYFDIGYIAELVGDNKTAVEMYSKVVEQFPEHPMAILAKSKLARVK